MCREFLVVASDNQIEVLGMWSDAPIVSKSNSRFKTSDAVSSMYYVRRHKG